MSSKTYQVPEGNVATLREAIDRIARRAERLGTPPITVEVGAAVDVPFVRDLSGDGLRRWDAAKDEPLAYYVERNRLRYRRYCDVVVSGETPRLAGWEFVATVQHLETGDGSPINLLRVVPGHDGDLPVRFRTSTPDECDHCQTRRRRNDTFVVRSVSAVDGVEVPLYMQIGRQCLQDFVGGEDPHAAARGLELLLQAHAAAGEAEESGSGGGRGGYAERWPLIEFLAVTAHFVRTDGWVSRSAARAAGARYTDGAVDAVRATADTVLEYLGPAPREGRAAAEHARWVAAHPISDEDRAAARAALDYARDDLGEKSERSDYEHNLYVACSQESVDARLAGIAASLVPYHLREVERLVLRERDAISVADSRHLGAEKSRLLLRVQCARIITVGLDSAYGPSYLHKLVTVDGSPGGAGHAVTWFSSDSENNIQPVAGPAWVKATVKRHDVRDGVAQTVVTRLVVLTDEDTAKELAKAERAATRARARAKAQPSPVLTAAIGAIMSGAE